MEDRVTFPLLWAAMPGARRAVDRALALGSDSNMGPVIFLTRLVSSGCHSQASQPGGSNHRMDCLLLLGARRSRSSCGWSHTHQSLWKDLSPATLQLLAVPWHVVHHPSVCLRPAVDFPLHLFLSVTFPLHISISVSKYPPTF